MDRFDLVDLIRTENDGRDPIDWVAMVAGALRETTVALLQREPTKREMEYLLGGYLLGLIEVQEDKDVSGT